MSDTTGIAWTDATWSPITGCERVSPGCAHCYAEQLTATRLAHQPKYKGLATITASGEPHWTGEVRIHEDELEKPLHWKKPRMIFVNSMSDTFHKDVPDKFIDRMFGIMARCPQHTFQVLTKRPERMKQYFWAARQGQVNDASITHYDHYIWFKLDDKGNVSGPAWPLPNVWLGVSAEDQQRWDERVEILRRIPAAVRFVSAEPLLGLIDVHYMSHPGPSLQNLQWVIVGGESGAGARPCNMAWIRSIVAQCKTAGVACFVKQAGSNPIDDDHFAKASRSNGDSRRLSRIRSRNARSSCAIARAECSTSFHAICASANSHGATSMPDPKIVRTESRQVPLQLCPLCAAKMDGITGVEFATAGGKFYNDHALRVSCYPEDETKERCRRINKVNKILSSLV